MNAATETTVKRTVEQKRVVGSGGRPRTVWTCEMGCWHNSYGQAMKCKNGIAAAKQAA